MSDPCVVDQDPRRLRNVGRHPQLLGGPFFTSVPAARIGTGKHAFGTIPASTQPAMAPLSVTCTPIAPSRRTKTILPTTCSPCWIRSDLAYGGVLVSNEAFQSALGGQEMGDCQYVRAVLPEEMLSEAAIERVGVSKLRKFLEQVLRDKYLLNVNSIIPQLQQACATEGVYGAG